MSGFNIGDLLMRVLADDTGFQADLVKKAEKAGDAAGATLGQRLSAGVKQHGAKILGTTLAAGFGIATKGLLELERVTADFAAETGASADEADRAGKAINAMAGRNIQPLAEVGEALAKVHTDLGLTGDEAERVTERFLKFGRATKQNAAAAVKDFDDILDAWGLTAADAGGIMDKLIVSHQRYGGSIEVNQKQLAALAPSLRAANLTIDDGIGLLNLFEASGVDSAAAVTGMTKALSKVKSPEELKALVADIIATEDPFLRAQKASDLFGVKAGAKLANALRPGEKALDEYQISVEDSAGATERAADVMDSTWGARFQLLLKGAGAALIGFGSNFGPAVTGLASLGSLAGALGGGKLLGGLASVLKKGGIRIAAALGVTFASSVVGGASEAGGEAIGSMTSKAIAKRLAGKAGGEAIASGLIGLESSAPVQSATSRLGSFLGTKLGKALSVAFAAVAVVELVKTYSDVTAAIRQQTDDLATQTGEFTRTATTEALQNARKGVAEDLAAMGSDPIADALGLSARKGVEQTLAQLDAEIQNRMTTIAEHTKGGAFAVGQAVDGAAPKVVNLGDAFTNMAGAVLRGVGTVISNVRRMASVLAAEAQAMIDGYYDPLIEQADLQVQKDQVAAAKRALAATKAGSAERHQAKLTLLNAQKSLEATRTALLAAGTLSAKEQKVWLSELQRKYKTATGDAKTKIGALIAKIKELQGTQGGGITITIRGLQEARGSHVGKSAAGGPIPANLPRWVGEEGPEIIVPRVASTVLSHAQSMAAVAGAGGGGDTNITVALPTTARPDPFEVASQLRRLNDFGVLGIPGPR